MAKSSPAVLGEAIRLAVGGDAAGQSDGVLLRRFAESGDQAAFATLFRRHSGMVLGVCRRALAGEQDAEDACQATFLVLSRKAKSGRWQQSVANWLYLTARRIAHNARVSAERRTRRENRAALSRPVQPVDRMTGRGLLDLLDLELGKLPPAYREPLVLCYLEGLTRDEAAARLGVPAATVKIRLERGRKRLGDALTKRGCVLGVGLLALAATSPSGASPPRLLQAALAVATGSPPASVAALAGGIAMHALRKVTVLGLLALAGVGLLAVGLEAGRPPEKPVPAETPAPERPGVTSPTRVTVPAKETLLRGKVVGVDGKPFPGAKLLLVGKSGRPFDQGTSAADGRFTAAIPADHSGMCLVARAEGYGVDFVSLRQDDLATEARLRLVPDLPIRGRVVNTQGQPLAGVRVRVIQLAVHPDDSLDTFLVDWKKRDYWAGIPQGVKALGAEAEQLFPALTDDDGRFALRGTGVERLVCLYFAGAGIAEEECYVVNRDGFDPKPYNEASVRNVPKGLDTLAPPRLLYGPDPIIVAEAEKPVRGVVTAADTGKGRPGVEVRLALHGGHVFPFSLKATTDAAGRYELHGARKAKVYMLQFRADVDGGYMNCDPLVSDTAGYAPITVDIRMAKGVIVTGRMFDRSTGKGVQGSVAAGALYDNPFAKDYPNFNSGASLTAADGSFRIVSIPGPVLLGGSARGIEARHRYKQSVPDPNYPRYFTDEHGGAFLRYGGSFSPMGDNACKVLEIKPGAGVVRQDIPLEPASVLPVLLRDAGGKPLTGVWATGTTTREWFSPEMCKTDTCSAYDVGPGRRRLLVLFEPGRRLAAALELKGDEKPPVVATLRPAGSVKGRLVGTDGRPLAGVAVDLLYKDRPAEEIHNIAYRSRQVVTGPDGSFVVDTILPGLLYDLFFKRQKRVFQLTAKPAAPMTVGSGEAKDMGNFTAKAVGEDD